MLNVGIYGKGMDQFVRDEAELGTRVAGALSQEEVDPLGWLVDILYMREFG